MSKMPNLYINKVLELISNYQEMRGLEDPILYITNLGYLTKNILVSPKTNVIKEFKGVGGMF